MTRAKSARKLPPEKGLRGSEGCAPALRARVSKGHRAKSDEAPDAQGRGLDQIAQAPPATPPQGREALAAEAWNLYLRATAAHDHQTATRAFRTYCELTGDLGTANRRRRKPGPAEPGGLAERLMKAAAALDKVPGVR